MEPDRLAESQELPRWDEEGELVDSLGLRDWHWHTMVGFVLIVGGSFFIPHLAKILNWQGLMAGFAPFVLLMVLSVLPSYLLKRRLRKLGYPPLSLTATTYASARIGFGFRRLPTYAEFCQLSGYPNSVLGVIRLALDIERTGGPIALEDAPPPVPDTSTGERWREWDLGATPGITRWRWHSVGLVLGVFLIAQVPLVGSILIGGAPRFGFMLLPLLMPLGIWAPGLWARSVMISKGYPTVTFGGGMRAFMVLGFDVRNVPRYEDFSMVPGYRNSLNGVFDLMRDTISKRRR